MKNFTITLILLVILGIINAAALFAQDPSEPNINIDAGLPTILGPSPEVASLMKFEEVPVNNYTGIPQIDIPIFSTNTLYSKLPVNVGLSYHASSINADEIAPYTGLGWNLMAGGAISRTVRGLPDEYLEYGRNPKIGLYHNNVGNNNNNYYYVMEGIINGSADTGWEDEEFKWDAYERGKYDTQHDLYQFEFMGHSGRFIIKKNLANNNLYVVPLDNNTNYRITFNYDSSSYKISSFNIIDENGIKYVFGIAEETVNSNFSVVTFQDIAGGNSSHSQGETFYSAFQLSKIYDPFNNLIVEFHYDKHQQRFATSTITRNSLVHYNLNSLRSRSGSHYEQNLSKMKPLESTSTNQRSGINYFIKKIDITGIGKIEFYSDDQREDSNLIPNSGARRLTEILVRDWKENMVKKMSFHYDYYSVSYPRRSDPLKRMILTEVRDYGNQVNNSEYQKYNLVYDRRTTYETVIKDPWGYFALAPGIINRQLEVEFITVGVLKEMLLPTGGKIAYDFEPATYSFIGDEALTEFNDNPLNGEDEDLGSWHDTLYVNGSVGYHEKIIYPLPGINSADYVILEVDRRNLGENFIDILKSHPNEGDTVIQYPCPASQEFCLNTIYLEPGYTYKIRVQNTSIGTTFNLEYDATFFKNGEVNFQYNYGGGIRIKSIGFYNDAYDDRPATQKSYNYTLLSNPSKSSGSLVFAKPLYELGSSIMHHFTSPGSVGDYNWTEEVSYWTKTNFNNLAYLKTQGANVGYKNVTITTLEQQNSYERSEYTYLSPLDNPETADDPDSFEGYFLEYPFLPPYNFDYKRGLLQNVSIYNSRNRKVKEILYNYEFSNETAEMSGILLALNLNNQCAYAYKYKFNDYLFRWQNYDGHDQLICPSNYPASHIQALPIKEAKGWAKLFKKEEIDYFDSENISKIVEYTYNDLNKQLHTKEASTSNPEETEITEYLYSIDFGSSAPFTAELIAANRIVEPIEVRKYLSRNGTQTLLQTTRAEFGLYRLGNINRYLPKYIFTHKGGNAPVPTGDMETQIVYHAYNKYGMPRDVSRKDGPRTSYIWGYNEQYPVAKIENASYAQATSPSIGLNFNKINNPTSSLELMNELGKIRYGLPGAMVTLYTYHPLRGIKSITDPKGESTWYEYDNFGRLILTKDLHQRPLSETEYHYRTTP